MLQIPFGKRLPLHHSLLLCCNTANWMKEVTCSPPPPVLRDDPASDINLSLFAAVLLDFTADFFRHIGCWFVCSFPIQEILERSCPTTTLACSYHQMPVIAGERYLYTKNHTKIYFALHAITLTPTLQLVFLKKVCSVIDKAFIKKQTLTNQAPATSATVGINQHQHVWCLLVS